ncbi:Crp/Fnr family transcriptional regulator [Mucilaginibacter psychrotolerans]|uniref:Crp/Fnr family transcriptional regulator n=1 Tax=Mucilaginibacter psychrotolerans TaxID=1524096 RepID=A0A4Y8SQI7_9SPHI|nr:Crp/Fnr family transcriptional regulator [Mucilaginibacter psychrotolerans]TFF40787.1 Crp/Fnr family transcriptional regulator [Mucilaginibacter psychrotolerans]
MIHLLRQHIQNRLGDDVEGLDKVLATFEERHFKRGELVLKQGDCCTYVYYIATGCLQVFIYDADINENTRDIVTEDNWCADLTSFGSGQPSAENIKAVEPCVLLAVSRPNFQQLMQTVPQFDKVYRQILEASYANSVYRINTFVSLSALDRIKWLMDYRPKLMSRLSNKLIASYLGISQETFSRLKAKI